MLLEHWQAQGITTLLGSKGWEAALCPSHTSCCPLQVPDSPAAFGVLQLGQPGVSYSATGIKLFLEARCWLSSSLQVTQSGREGSQKYSSELNKKNRSDRTTFPVRTQTRVPALVCLILRATTSIWAFEKPKDLTPNHDIIPNALSPHLICTCFSIPASVPAPPNQVGLVHPHNIRDIFADCLDVLGFFLPCCCDSSSQSSL